MLNKKILPLMLCTGIVTSTPFIGENFTTFAEMNQKQSMFSDVPQEHWAYPAIKHLTNQGIIAGYGNNIFGMGDEITREQVAALIDRTLKIHASDTFQNPYHDIIDEQSTMFFDAILNVTQLGIFRGDEHGNFRPKDTVTRAEMAQIIAKTFQLKAKEASIFDDVSQNHWAFKAIQAVKSNGIALGIGHNQFAPDMKVTREQYAQFLYKAILATQYGSKKIILDNNQNMYVAQKSGNECWFASYLMTINYINGSQSDYATEKQMLSETELMKQYKKIAALDPFIGGGGADLVVSCLNQDPTLHYKHSFYSKNTPDSILTSLTNNKPVILGLNYGNNFGHYIVIVGIEKNINNCTLWYYDPRNPKTDGTPRKGTLQNDSFENKKIGDIISM
ncbi:S-layer homology domain-containing protein [Bacillus thuringiensis]|uniref:S-layer homology domain-containing protein n=1 Tax=Bacillus thuringiensis TaxID=1428 RepID=UPI003BF6385A